VISAAVSLTLVPMLCARLLHHRPSSTRSAWDLQAERGFQWIIDRYGRGLEWVLDHETFTLSIAGITLVVTLLLYIFIPKGFFPVQDTGEIQGISEAAESISYEAMAERQQVLAAAILKDPDVQSLSSFIGVDGANTTLNSGRFLINLKPHGERHATASEIIRRLKQETAGVVGITLYMQPLQDITIDSAVSRTQYQFVVESTDNNDFATWIPPLMQKLTQLPELADVASDMEQLGTATDLVIDRSTAARFGITPATVDNVLYDSFGQRIVSTIYTQSNQYRVILEADPSIQRSLKGLSELYLPSSVSSTNGQVPLSAIVSINQRAGPLQITHLGQFPATTISFNLSPGSSLGAAVDAIHKVEQDIHLPAKFVTAFQGTAAAFQHVLTNQALLLLASIVTMYIVLGVLYESFIHPITILSTLPSAGIGAMLALIIAGDDLDVLGIIGIILLIGIVKKNAIMMIDFALDAQRKQGLAPREAITRASLLRFRPILMTTMAALLGALPLMLSYGAGSELRRPLGIAIVGGLIMSQLLTLFTTPVIYLAFDRVAARLRRRRADADPAPV
jgi:multidrug efflux pump